MLCWWTRKRGCASRCRIRANPVRLQLRASLESPRAPKGPPYRPAKTIAGGGPIWGTPCESVSATCEAGSFASRRESPSQRKRDWSKCLVRATYKHCKSVHAFTPLREVTIYTDWVLVINWLVERRWCGDVLWGGDLV